MRKNRYIFLTAVLFLMSQTLWATISYQFLCTGNRGRIAISMYTDKERLYLFYSNALGAVDFPLYEGIVTRATIPYVNIAEKELASLDYEVLLSWPLGNCEFKDQDPLLMKCNGEATIYRPENSPVQSNSVHTAHQIEEGLDNTFHTFKIRWTLIGENFHHFLALPFDPTKCKATLKRF